MSIMLPGILVKEEGQPHMHIGPFQAMKASLRGFANVDNMIPMVYLKSTFDHSSISSNSLLRGV